MFESSYLREKDALINKLVNLYPYPRKWFENQRISVLLSIYYSRTSSITVPSVVRTSRAVRRVNTYGEPEVLADNGEWEIEID